VAIVLHCLLYVRWVRVTGAFLAEAAEVVDNKLNVQGGVLASCPVGPDRIANVTLVVLTQAEAGTTRAALFGGSSVTTPPGGKPPKLNIELLKPSGHYQALQIDIPEAALGGDNGFAYFPMVIPAETDGRYMLIVSSGGPSVCLSLRVQGQLSPPGPPTGKKNGANVTQRQVAPQPA